MISIHEVAPDIEHHILQMVAEILACADPDPAKRTEHRLSKLATFPDSDRDQVREIAIRVIKARTSNA